MKYLDTLQQAWAQHLAPRQADAPTVISTFAGAGGSSLGYSMAGFKELLAVECDRNAIANFKLNFPDVPVYQGDIADLSVREMLKLSALSPGELDLLDGSPPCQGFSTTGKRDFNDPRNYLFREYVRLLRGLKPKVLLMENVSGLVKGQMKLIFQEILEQLKESGYRVASQLLNAKYYGVPQSRERMIIIGVRNDLELMPTHPLPQTAPPLTVADAWQDLADPGMYKVMGGKLAAIVPLIRPGEGADDVHRRRGEKPNDFSLIRLHFNKPSNTIVKSIRPCLSGLLHPAEDRFLGINELKRLNSLPDEFQLVGRYEEQWARVGNSVPPLFMRAIARHIRAQIFNSKVSQQAA